MLTKEQIAELTELSKKHKVVADALEEIKSIYDEPTKLFYKELSQTIAALATEMSHVRNGKKELAPIIASDDKTFERVIKLSTDADKIFNGLRKGKEDIDPESAKSEHDKEKEEGMSFTDRQANKNRKNL